MAACRANISSPSTVVHPRSAASRSSRVARGEGYYYHLSGLVNQGLSGCALYLPSSGEVVGVVTRQFGPEGLGMGFGGAVPGVVVSRLLEGVVN